jgi:hypothetical protein
MFSQISHMTAQASLTLKDWMDVVALNQSVTERATEATTTVIRVSYVSTCSCFHAQANHEYRPRVKPVNCSPVKQGRHVK